MKELCEILSFVVLFTFIAALFFFLDGSPDVYDVLRNQVLNQQCK